MRKEFFLVLRSKRFVFAAIVILFCLLGLSIPEWLSSISWGAEFRQSALQQSISGIFFGGVMLLLPFCSCMSYTPTYVEEISSSHFRWSLIRTSICKYAFRKISVSFCSGGFAVVIPFIVHSLIWNLIALPCDPIRHPYHEIIFADGSLYAKWYSIMYGLPMYASIACGMFIAGACWATVGLAVAMWLPDRLLSIIVPACMYYLVAAGVFDKLLGIQILHPATLFNDALTCEAALQALSEYALLFFISVFIFILGLKRRGQNE